MAATEAVTTAARATGSVKDYLRTMWRQFKYYTTHLRASGFVYPSSIGTGQIRLIRFAENRTLWPSIPSLIIETYELGSCPPFCALSYTWGPPESGAAEYTSRDMLPISLNSGRVLIRPNLYSALKQLRTNRHASMHFWIDALCINQADIKEKSDQVNSMDAIYKHEKNTTTIIWLGDETKYTPRALSIVRRSSPAAKQQLVRLLKTQKFGHPDKPSDPAAFQSYGMPPISEEEWEALNDLFSRSWFQRMWVVQELALSNDAEMICGRFSIPWDDVGLVAGFLGTAGFTEGLWRHDPSGSYNATIMGLSCALHLYVIRQGFLGGSDGDEQLYRLINAMDYAAGISGTTASSTLVKLLSATGSFSATDIRDKIFATLGILKQIAVKSGLTIPGDFYADYNLSAAQVFSNFTKVIITETKSLHLITLGGDPDLKQVPDLPSWTPDFSFTRSIPILGPNFHSMRQPDASGCSTSSESGEPDENRKEAKISLDESGKKLGVSGFRLGTVTALGDSLHDVATTSNLDATASMLLQLKPTYPFTDQPRAEALWRTLVRDQNFSVRPAPPDFGRHFRAWIHLIIWKGLVQEFASSDPGFDGLLERYKLIDAIGQTDEAGLFPTATQLHGMLIEFRRVVLEDDPNTVDSSLDAIVDAIAKDDPTPFETVGVQNAMLSKRTFVTDSGYLASGVDTTMKGNEVWIVSGCPTPLILVQVDSTNYKMLGEAYVHGAMFGEAVREQTNWQDISLV